MTNGEPISKQKLIKLYWPQAYYDLEDLGYVKSVGQKRRGCPSSYIILKKLPTPRRLRRERDSVRT